MKLLIALLIAALAVFVFCAIGCVIFYLYVIRRNRKQPRLTYVGQTDTTNWRGFASQAHEGILWLAQQQCELVTITSYDGLALYGHLFTCKGAQRSILLMHGFRSCGFNDFNAQAQFYMEKLHCNVLIVDQRAHGLSEGKHICYGAKEQFDCRDWLKFLDAAFGSRYPLYLNGISMGCATSLLSLALPGLPETLRGCVADSGYTSAWDEFAYVIYHHHKVPAYPLIPMMSAFTRIFAGWSFRDTDVPTALARVTLPILFIHGLADDFVSPDFTVRNFQACVSPNKNLVTVPGAEHPQSYFVDTPLVTQAIMSFIGSCE